MRPAYGCLREIHRPWALKDNAMNFSELGQHINTYGLLFVFLIVFLEYLNIPGLPGGLIFLLTGLWIKSGNRDFVTTLVVTGLAGLAGSCLLYFLGKKGGNAALSKLKISRPQSADRIDALTIGLLRHGCLVVFLAKLTPIARTLVGIPAGMVGMDLKNYILVSALGITIWNGALILAGMYGSELILQQLQ
mgnify:FL=1